MTSVIYSVLPSTGDSSLVLRIEDKQDYVKVSATCLKRYDVHWTVCELKICLVSEYKKRLVSFYSFRLQDDHSDLLLISSYCPLSCLLICNSGFWWIVTRLKNGVTQ
jgi:hypothetical protein